MENELTTIIRRQACVLSHMAPTKMTNQIEQKHHIVTCIRYILGKTPKNPSKTLQIGLLVTIKPQIPSLERTRHLPRTSAPGRPKAAPRKKAAAKAPPNQQQTGFLMSWLGEKWYETGINTLLTLCCFLGAKAIET